MDADGVSWMLALYISNIGEWLIEKRSMDKKKATKKAAKEVSLGATAEDETTHQQPLTPRKRGRPRKIVDKVGSEEAPEVREYESKKVKSSEEIEQKEEVKEEEACDEVGEGDLSKVKPSGSRARRKSKPRRSC